MKKLVVPIAGMHCRSCEILIEDKLSEVPEIKKSHVSYKRGVAEISFENKPAKQAIEDAVRSAGYTIGVVGKKPWFSQNKSDYKDLGLAFLFVVAAYFFLKEAGLSELLNVGGAGKPTSLSVALLVGLTAGFSTCLALVGGLVLGIAARHSEKHPEATPMQKFRPHLFFNLGRILSYAFLGGLLGSLGSFLQLSGSTLGIVTIVVGAVMLLLGVKLMGISPRLETVNIALPKWISRKLGIGGQQREYSHTNSFMLGAMTFFLPCGFTQAMQIYAVSTGSFVQGSLIMGLFALGTAPGLLGIGGLTSVIKGIFAQRFFKFAGIVVVLLAFFNINNGLNLANWQWGTSAGSETKAAVVQAADPNVKIENGVQVVRMTESARGYTPNKFTIQQGIPVKWVIDAQEPYSCASSIIASKIGVRKNLTLGENVIEFTPKEIGQISFSCSMGMYRGVFNVVDGQGALGVQDGGTTAQALALDAPQAGSCGSSGGGCGCGGGGKAVVPTEGTVATEKKSGTIGEQVINTTYTAQNDIQPNTFQVKAGQPVRFVVDVQDEGSGCMSTIMIPGLSGQPQFLEKGTKLEMAFTPQTKGTYKITCAMGVARGTITVS